MRVLMAVHLMLSMTTKMTAMTVENKILLNMTVQMEQIGRHHGRELVRDSLETGVYYDNDHIRMCSSSTN